MKTVTEICTTNVTDEQKGRCHKVYDGAGRAFYAVLSESDNLTEYHVKWSKEHGFTCSCKAGQEAFRFCRNGVCKHVVWSVATEREVRAELKARAAREDAEKAERLAEARRKWMLAARPEPHMKRAPAER